GSRETCDEPSCHSDQRPFSTRNTSSSPSPSKSPTRKLAAVAVALRTVSGVHRESRIQNQVEPVARRASVRPFPSKSPNTHSESAVPPLRRTTGAPLPPDEKRHSVPLL